MSTMRSRHAVTETEEIAQVLGESALRWPGVSRSKLIHYVLADWAVGARSSAARAEARKELIGSLPESSELYDREQDWPE